MEKASGLNFEEMKIALSKLARWHAATAYLGVSVNIFYAFDIIYFGEMSAEPFFIGLSKINSRFTIFSLLLET